MSEMPQVSCAEELRVCQDAPKVQLDQGSVVALVPDRGITCEYCGAPARIKKVEKHCEILVNRRVPGKKHWKKQWISVWRYYNKVIDCKACRERSKRESARRDKPDKWTAYMKRNPLYFRMRFPVADIKQAIERMGGLF